MNLRSVAVAAHNNALWCDAVCRAHGLPTMLDRALWRCLRPAPPFYPNAVTLDPDAPGAQIEQVRTLIDAGLGVSWAVKDSFAALDLTSLGFALLFEAAWIGGPPATPVAAQSGLRWETVRDGAELGAWEAAWAGAEPPPARIFLPILLAEPGVTFLAACRETRIVAGGILNVTGAGADRVVGLSNTFAAPGEDARACWLGAAAQAAHLAPGLPLAGYEHGDALAWALEAGFAQLGPLRVWARG